MRKKKPSAFKKITMYLHGDKETSYDAGVQLGLKGEALEMFKFALYEISVELRVDMKTGLSQIVKMDGRELK